MAAPADPAVSGRPDRLELFGAILLAAAAVLTAWSSYQATRWNGEQAKAASQTNAIRIEAARTSERANAETEVDVATFIAWADARGGGKPDLEAFYLQRFRPEFRPAFDAWVGAEPFTDPTAPRTPFAMPEYRLATQRQAAGFDRDAEASAATVREDIQRASNYVLAVVLFAVALFFGGISTKLANRRLRILMVLCGYAVLAGALAWIVVSPVTVSV